MGEYLSVWTTFGRIYNSTEKCDYTNEICFWKDVVRLNLIRQLNFFVIPGALCNTHETDNDYVQSDSNRSEEGEESDDDKN